MDKKINNLVIGSGPAGIGAALALEQDGLVLEANNLIGGFSSSIEIDGAIFDFGGHSFHTPHPEIKELVYNSLEMYEQKREARCYVSDEMIPYPFQKNYQLLSNKEIVKECSLGISNEDFSNSQFENFEEFIISRFGKGISEHFMLPYNRKLWGRDLKRLAADWTKERVAAPSGVRESFKTSGGSRKPLQSDTKVGYPAKGGFGEIFYALGKKIKNIDLNRKVIRIDPKAKTLHTVCGKIYSYNTLISTIPIIELIRLIEGFPDSLIIRSNELDFLSLKLGMIVINHPVDTEIQRIYSSEESIPAHKTAVNHNSSDYLRGLPRHGIMMEISEGPEKSMIIDDMDECILDSLLRFKLIKSPSEVEKIVIKNAKYAYPVPTHNRDEIVSEIQDHLSEMNIHSVGRFGQWAYINSDEALARGYLLGKQILGGK